MKLQKIITLANKSVELPFKAMERSLRATGCQLPIWVIPYDDELFDLPANSHWWREEEVIRFLDGHKAFPACRKFQCFLTSNYQFVDSDVIFLRNPEEVLLPLEGFVASCLHWTHPGHTYTDESLPLLEQKSTLWPSKVFNSGQYACDITLYDLKGLIASCEGTFRETLITKTPLYKDQPAINLLVHLSDVKISNITLPPYEMESTWAGHYLSFVDVKDIYASYWRDKQRIPYLIHWAGCSFDKDNGVNSLFFQYLSEEEKAHFLKSKRGKAAKNVQGIRLLFSRLKRKLRQIGSKV